MNWIPTIEVESAYGVREEALRTRFLMKRKIFLDGPIDANSANFFVEQLMYLQEESNEEIDLYINSPGGEVTNGLLIYDAIQSSKAPINMYCSGIAASMAAVILAGGEKGRRYILPHSKVMIHEPLIRDGMGGNATSIQTLSESILETRDLLNGILAKHAGKTVEQINEATKFDNYMSAEQAIEFGLVDEIKNLF